ncbi:unnamed protein product [Paramecium pentaurelia]|uniref:Ribosomal protein L1 n=1 Tax=Paramecium pentaurelia TaxID=43138 RepID=A0A8S1T1F5_9CILI|nr:unnamed protein product [Paramecium pentaurelia]
MGKNIEQQEVEKNQTKEQVLAIKKNRITKIGKSIRKLVVLDQKQIKKAINALLKYRESTHTDNILDIKDDFIYLEIVLNKLPIKYSLRPVQIKLPNAIYNQEMNSKFCIISTNPQRQFKDQICEFDIPLIQKVIGYGKLNKKYPTYTDKRKLFYEYDQFFCDQRIYGNLAKGLGKIFYERKKIPFPINCENITQEALNDLSNSTYFIQGNGPVYTVKIGRVAQTADQITQNVLAAAYDVLPNVLQEKGMSLSCLRQLNVKLSSSISLPFYSRLSVREIEAWKNQ